MRYVTFILVMLPVSILFANDYCFVCKDKTQISNNVEVIVQQQNVIPLEQQEYDIEQELALQRQWEMLSESISIAPRIDQTNLFRKHKFNQNIQNIKTKEIQYSTVPSRVLKKRLTGYIKQSFSVNNRGIINFTR